MKKICGCCLWNWKARKGGGGGGGGRASGVLHSANASMVFGKNSCLENTIRKAQLIIYHSEFAYSLD